MEKRLILLVCLTLAQCSPTGPTVHIDEEFVLARGETATLADSGMRVKFVGVDGDSRCPADAFCIQGGDAIVRVEVRSGGRAQSFELHTGNMQPVQHENLVVRLVQLVPYPFSSRTIQPDEYRATLRLSRAVR
jgi:hypothetical protein